MSNRKLLEIKNINFSVKEHQILKDISFSIEREAIIGLVGESGCGKTTLSKIICGLLKPDSGEVFFKGNNLTSLSLREWRPFRKKIQMVFQNSMGSLNSRLKIVDIVSEGIKNYFPDLSQAEIQDKVVYFLGEVGLSENFLLKNPNQLSGGQRQRIGIARAIAVDPELILLDEPVSALDVSIQAQILNLLIMIHERSRMTYLFISHDLSVVQVLCNYVIVMHRGEIVEHGTSAEVLEKPKHPYTKQLVSAIPPLGYDSNWLFKKFKESLEDENEA